MQLIRKFNSNINPESRVLISVMRDENILLEYFINYYKNCGITHFIIVDNGSEDGGFEYLLSLHANIMLFRTTDSYKDAGFGTDWVNNILSLFCRNVWCLVVDIDELLFTDNINILIESMEKENSNFCQFLLLDMYSKELNEYIKGNSFLDHSNYFDKYSNKYYFIFNTTNYIKDEYAIHGGVRRRITSSRLKTPITKNSLFFNNFKNIKLSHGYHSIWTLEDKKVTPQRLEQNNLKPYSRMEYLLHFKFIKPNFHSFIQKRIENNQDWNNSLEYRNYNSINLNNLYDTEYSVKLQSKSQLDSIFHDLVFLKLKPSINKHESTNIKRSTWKRRNNLSMVFR